jgi:hypothetical protein
VFDERPGSATFFHAAAMRTPSVHQREMAKRLLAAEGDSGASSDASATAAAQVHDKLAAQLGPVLGVTGVEALFMRSATLAAAEHPLLAQVAAVVDGPMDRPTRLRACLQALEPAAASEVAAALLGTFLELIVMFIGDRLTVQALRGAWPTIEEMAPPENSQ